MKTDSDMFRGDRPANADPFAKKRKPKRSPILVISELIGNVFSHKGMFWFGVSVALVSFFFNVQFWAAVFAAAGQIGAWQWIWGFSTSFATSLFELIPVVWLSSRKRNLEQQFAAASNPDVLPELNPNVTDAEGLRNDYKNMDANSRKFFKWMRRAAIALEILLGIVFLGNVGVGVPGLFRLILFVGSIFGVEWGVVLALRAADWELSPEVRKKLNDLLDSAGSNITMKKV